MTWNDLVRGLREVQVRATEAPSTCEALVQLGWIVGRDGGPDGYTLTARGRDILRRADLGLVTREAAEVYERAAVPLTEVLRDIALTGAGLRQ